MEQFINFKNFYFGDPVIITEELHPELASALDADFHPANRLKHFTHKVRNLIKRGEDTGLMDDKPKKGSSRAVFFPKDPHPLVLDGQATHMPTVVKIAFHGHLDKYNHSGMLLGEHQNLTEADHFLQRSYSVIRQKDDGSWETNHDTGILAPVIHAHPEGHYLHIGRVEPIRAGEFRALTKTPDFPKGISHKEFQNTLLHHHEVMHGRGHFYATPKNVDQLSEHPLIHSAMSFMADGMQHPGDYRTANMGVWKHPITGQRKIVIADFGYSHAVAKHYTEARRNESLERQKREFGIGRW